MPTAHWRFDPASNSLMLAVNGHSFPFDTSGVDELLSKVGEMREQMQPAIPLKYTSVETVLARVDPAWWVESEAMMGNIVFHLRDPPFGWLHYMMPKPEVRKLIDLLQKQVDAPEPGREQGRAN